ncbi:MAG: SCO family protein [Marmoricola sp.]
MSTTSRAKPRRTLQALTATLLAVSVLAACGTAASNDQKTGAAAVVERDKDGLNGTLVNPPLRLASVTLRDTRDNRVRLNEFAPSRATVLFFGFTHCDDVCPTTMADLASARRTLPPALAKRVLVVFVTVDPRRDTPTVLRTWLDQFDTETVGLRGPTALVHQAERSLYADQSTKAQTEPSVGATKDGHQHTHDPGSSASTDYQVNHSGSVYVFGPHGETVLYSGGTTVDQYAADLTRLLAG